MARAQPPAQDGLARAAVLFALGVVAVALAKRFPEALHAWLVVIRWPSLQADWLPLIQLAYPAFIVALALLVVQYLRQPRPSHAAQIVALIALLLMLPQTFSRIAALNILSSHVLLMLVVAIAHEAYLMAFRDELTGLPGRRALNERLQRLGRQYVLAMADVDHFKSFNDTHGHDVGDQVLKMVASRLRKVGGGGRAYRYGGEEFTLVFPGRSVEQCLPHLEAVRQAIEGYALQLRDASKRPRMTARTYGAWSFIDSAGVGDHQYRGGRAAGRPTQPGGSHQGGRSGAVWRQEGRTQLRSGAWQRARRSAYGRPFALGL